MTTEKQAGRISSLIGAVLGAGAGGVGAAALGKSQIGDILRDVTEHTFYKPSGSLKGNDLLNTAIAAGGTGVGMGAGALIGDYIGGPDKEEEPEVKVASLISALIGNSLDKKADFPWKSIGGMVGGGALGTAAGLAGAHYGGADRQGSHIAGRLGGLAGLLGGGVVGGALEDQDDIDDEEEALSMLQTYVANNKEADPDSAAWAQNMLDEHAQYKKVLG